jgi:hypothetical protein
MIACIGAAVFAIGLIVTCLGFTSRGVGGGSYAASMQSGYGDVSGGSCFSMITSCAMKNIFILFIILGPLLIAFSWLINEDDIIVVLINKLIELYHSAADSNTKEKEFLN